MANKTINARLPHSRDTSANWTKYDPVLLDGEIVIVDTDAGEVRYKVGDGKKKYSQLPFNDEAIRTLIGAKADKTNFGNYTAKNPALTASSGVCTWSVSHNIGKKVVYKIIETSTKEEVLATVIVTSDNVLTVKFRSNANISAGTYEITVIGCNVNS